MGGNDSYFNNGVKEIRYPIQKNEVEPLSNTVYKNCIKDLNGLHNFFFIVQWARDCEEA